MGYFRDIRRVDRRISRGKVATYVSVARAAGHPGTARQIAWALQGADSVGLSWRRVFGSGGRILLPGESRLHKKTLLRLEGVDFLGERVNMGQCEHKSPARMRSKDSPPNRRRGRRE